MKLTSREQQAYDGVVNGDSDKRIADDLAISKWTVRDLLRTVVAKVGGTGSARKYILRHAARRGESPDI